MTAIVGVMNKQAVAIAADSAVTIQNSRGRKIQNHANKIFTLSKYHPVGVMIFNSATFMGTPWETIIKLYRNSLKDKEFDLISEYADDFLQFIESHNYFCSEEMKYSYLENEVFQIYIQLRENALNSNGGLTEDTVNTFISFFKKEVKSIIDYADNSPKVDSLYNYTFDRFIKYTNKTFDIIEEDFFDKLIDKRYYLEFRDNIEKCIYAMLNGRFYSFNSTGIVFVGFGKEEIFPVMIPYDISFLVDDTLRYFIDEDKKTFITHENNACVNSFAQTDVIYTIVEGIEPVLEQHYDSNIEKVMSKYNEALSNMIRDVDDKLADEIKNIDVKVFTNELKKNNLQIKQEKFIAPLIDTIATLSKEDLIEIAESLISLTSLKRKITFSEESVGGAVDVAIITKGDGFIWIKRKHYFEKELNSSFTNNYLR